MNQTEISIAVMFATVTPFILNAQTSAGTVFISGSVTLSVLGWEDCNSNGIPDDVEMSGTEWAELTALDATTSDSFGNFVSISGDLAVIGAYGNDDSGSGSGSAYVYRYDGSTWVAQAKLTASDAAAGDIFGISVSVSGDVAVIGARDDDDAGSNSGSAYVFQEPASGWMDMTETAKLTASDAAEEDRFGVAVAINGDVVLIGARNDNGGSGSAYIFQKPAGGWADMTETAKLTASDAEANDAFGRSVSVSGDVVVIGASGDDDGGNGAGAAYAFRKPAGGWVDMTETAKLTASDATAGDGFGGSASVSGALAVIGAVGDDDLASDAGAAYIFREPAGGWVDMTQTAKITASDGAYHEVFGSAVSVSGDLAVIGAMWDTQAGFDSGAAYVFGRNMGGADQWGEIAKLTASDTTTYDTFGYTVSVSGNLAAIGAHGHDHAAGDAGAAYVFAVGSTDCNINDILDDCDIAEQTSSDCQPNGMPDECDIAEGISLDQDQNGMPDECDRPADLNGDGEVNANDLAMLLGSWGPQDPCPPFVPADIDQDCSVDAADLAQLLGDWGP